MLGLLLAAEDEGGNRLSEAGVVEQVLLLLFAGRKMTVTLLSCLVFELGNNRGRCDRLQNEQAEVVGDSPYRLQLLEYLPASRVLDRPFEEEDTFI